MPIVYKLTSPSRKIYVGLTKAKLSLRFRQHCYAAFRWDKSGRPYTSHCPKLYAAIVKYGKEAWDKEVLFEGTDEEAREKEIEFIASLNSIENGYNILIGGQTGHSGRKLSSEHKQRISDARKKYYKTDDGKAWLKHLRAENKQILQQNALKKVKTYEITKPDGTTETITNMRKYCRDNDLKSSGMILNNTIGKPYKSYKVRLIE